MSHSGVCCLADSHRRGTHHHALQGRSLIEEIERKTRREMYKVKGLRCIFGLTGVPTSIKRRRGRSLLISDSALLYTSAWSLKEPSKRESHRHAALRRVAAVMQVFSFWLDTAGWLILYKENKFFGFFVTPSLSFL